LEIISFAGNPPLPSDDTADFGELNGPEHQAANASIEHLLSLTALGQAAAKFNRGQ
jgi:hypothetical protein